MTCKWCGLALHYLSPPVPGDAVTDLPHYYRLDWGRVWRSYQLIDTTGSPVCKGIGARHQPGVAVGQYPVHERA